MAKTNLSGAQKLLKIVLDQVAGEGDPKKQLIPAYAIQGKGDIMCWDPNSRMFKKVARGTTVYILRENYDHNSRSLVYTVHGDIVCIDPEEIFLLIGFD